MNLTFRLSTMALLPAFLLPASGVLAQSAQRPNYNIGDALREAAPTRPPVEKAPAAPQLPEMQDDLLEFPDDQTLYVREFHLEGTEAKDEAALQEVLRPYTDQNLTLGKIYEAANRVTLYYRQKGFVLAKALVPRQDASSGILTIRLSLGRYGRISFQNDGPVADFLVDGVFNQAITPDGPVTKDELERAMLLISDMPGMSTPKIHVAPGQMPGTTDVLLKTERAERFGGYVMADNFGSHYTGRNRLTAGLDVNSPLSMGDRLSLYGMTTEAAGLQNGRAAYSFPVYSNGLRGEVAAARTTYKLGDIYRDLEASGVANSVEGRLSYPLRRSQDETIALGLSGALRLLKDRSMGEYNNPRKTQVGTFFANREASSDLFGLRLTSTVASTVTLGQLDFNNVADELANKDGANTAGTFAHANLNASGRLALDKDWSLLGTFVGQKALMDKNLDGSEQMSISGPNGVQVYPEGVSGDNGYLVSAEVQYALPTWGDFSHSLGLLTQMGRSYIQNNEYTSERNGTRLADIGLGYYTNFEYQDGKYLTGKVLFLHVLGPQQETGERSAKAKVLAQIGLTF